MMFLVLLLALLVGGGKRILEKPIEAVLKTQKPDFPFCLGWANHSLDKYLE